jgi:transposase-like protein
MLGFGPPVDRGTRREWWRRQIQRQQQSNVPVAEFCRRHGINVVTFYSWKRRFRDASQAVELNRSKPQVASKPASSATFVPVSILESSSTGQLEIAFGNNCTLRLKGAIDPQLLRVAIRAAGRIRGTAQGAD